MLRQRLFTPTLFIIIAALACNAPFIGDGRTASLSELRNVVQSKSDANAAYKAATDSDKIISNGAVKTGNDSRVRLSITDGTIIRLGDNTEFVLRELSSTSTDPITGITLLSGKMWVAVTSALGNGKFDVNTPVGAASVRGSFMSVEYFPNGQMISSCLEGRCRLVSGNGKGVDLKTGEQSEIPGLNLDPTPPKAIDPKQIADWRNYFPEAGKYVATVIPGPLPTATRLGAGAPIAIGTPLAGATVVVPAGAVGQTACDHPYFPIRNGASWTYTTSEGNMTWNVNGVSGDKNNATASMAMALSNLQFNRAMQCSGANGITADLFSVASFGQASGVQMTTSNATGIFLPSADKLKPGYSWSGGYDIQMQVGGQSMNGKATQQYVVTGVGKVTVGGKSYDSIEVKDTINQTISFVGIPANTITVNSLMTFAKDIGIVKISAQGEGINSTVDLASFNIP